MKRLIAITGMFAGALLILIPRFILPACEYEGYPHMHCSDTAHAVMLCGAILFFLGVAALFIKAAWLLLTDAVLACGVLAVAVFLPDVYGYCASKNMPCHYGMVPGIRSVSALAMAILLTGIVILIKELRKRRP